MTIYNPAHDDDPLIQYGVIDSRVPGRDVDESNTIWNNLIRWRTPRLRF